MLVIITIVVDKPVIQIGQRKYTGLLSKPVSIIATVTGVPGPTVTWKFNDQNVPTDDNLKIIVNGDIHEINISKSDFMYAGTYKITAVNTVGQDQKTVTLRVLGL